MLHNTSTHDDSNLPCMHLSSMTVVLAIQIAGIVSNCGATETSTFELAFGYPWQYGFIDQFATGDSAYESVLLRYEEPLKYWWQINQLQTAKLLPLLANTAFWFCGSLVIGAVFEFRRRRRQMLWDLTRRDLLAAFVILSIVGYRATRLYSDNLNDARFAAMTAISDLDQPINHYYCNSAEPSTELPHNWFWDTLSVPYEYRPAVRKIAHIDNTHREPLPVSHEAIYRLHNYRHLEQIELTGVNLPPNATQLFLSWPKLRKVTLLNCELPEQLVQELLASSQLDDLFIQDATHNISIVNGLSIHDDIQRLTK